MSIPHLGLEAGSNGSIGSTDHGRSNLDRIDRYDRSTCVLNFSIDVVILQYIKCVINGVNSINAPGASSHFGPSVLTLWFHLSILVGYPAPVFYPTSEWSSMTDFRLGISDLHWLLLGFVWSQGGILHLQRKRGRLYDTAKTVTKAGFYFFHTKINTLRRNPWFGRIERFSKKKGKHKSVGNFVKMVQMCEMNFLTGTSWFLELSFWQRQSVWFRFNLLK